ncbi:MAG: TerB family tellurite resistance protein [Pseudomonadota bacterium]
MFAFLKTIFEEGGAETPADEAHAKALAAATLFFEAAASDGTIGTRELERISHLLTTRFSLTEIEAQDMCRQARDRQSEAIEMSNFTRDAKQRFAPNERIDLMEMLWEVAYADGVLEDFEANLMRRLSGLLYVDDRDNGKARKRAIATLGLKPGLNDA